MDKQVLLLFSYNKDVICIIDKGNPLCKTTEMRTSDKNLPSHEPYIPNVKEAKFYNCTSHQCEPVILHSITQISSPGSSIRFCHKQSDEYTCQILKYHSYKNVDKLLFLSNHLPNKEFFFVDCLVYSDGGRVCHRKDEAYSYAKLVDTGKIVRPKEPNVLSQDELLCEQSADKTIRCDSNKYVPYNNELKVKDSLRTDTKILLKSGSMLVTLDYSCIDSWCGYMGKASPTRRMEHYDPPGGKVYRCYYAKRQQVCKELYGRMRPVYNERHWLSS